MDFGWWSKAATDWPAKRRATAICPRSGSIVDLTKPTRAYYRHRRGPAARRVVDSLGRRRRGAGRPAGLALVCRESRRPVDADRLGLGKHRQLHPGGSDRSGVPQQIYVRLEVRDEAGNVGSDETQTPVLIDRQRPQGRICGVRPTTGSLPAAGTPRSAEAYAKGTGSEPRKTWRRKKALRARCLSPIAAIRKARRCARSENGDRHLA